MQKTYSIGELAKEFDITLRTIRFYQDEGMINPTRVGTMRVYSKRDRIRLKLLLRGKRLGFSLKEAHEIVNLYDTPLGEQEQLRVLLDNIEQKQQLLRNQQQDIDDMLSDLKELKQKCFVHNGETNGDTVLCTAV